jgi:FkbH-like protein
MSRPQGKEEIAASVKMEGDGYATMVRDIQRHLVREESDPKKHLAYLIERFIAQSPTASFEWLRNQKTSEIQSIPALPPLLSELGLQLLEKQDLRSADDLLRLSTEWQLPADTGLTRKLAKAYQRRGNIKKAREVLERALKRRSCELPEIIRDLYGIAKGENRFADAQKLLDQLIQSDASLSTVSFAFKERKTLPPEAGRTAKIAVLSSYTIDPLLPYLDYECRKAGLVPDLYLAPFNQYMQETLQPTSALYRFKPEIVLLALAIEDLYPAIRRYPSSEDLHEAAKTIRAHIRDTIYRLRESNDAIVVLCDFMLMHRSPHGILDNKQDNGLVRWVEDLNRSIREDLQSESRAYLLPLREVIGWVGTKQTDHPKMRHMASIRLSGAALPELARYLLRYIKPVKGLTRKCIVLDLDGTLWGGIAGEVGIEGIQLGPTAPGAEYMDFQEALLNLTRRGVLLTICSKNNSEDVLPIIQNHPHMLLRDEHFAAVRINWKNKAENVREIAEELNIGLDALVFMDDNPNERELIRQLLPDVLTVDMPTDPAYYRATIEEMSDFELLALTEEDELRVAQYHAMHQRRAVQNTAASLEEYFHSLDIRAEINLATSQSLNRLVQMFNKTNQFNLTTRKYQAADMERFFDAAGYRVYTLRVRDRFGDHGLVGTAIIRDEGRRWHIDSMLMSCRVMGLFVETAFLHAIYQDAVGAGAAMLVGEFILTKKNQPAADFYSRHGFSRTTEKEEVQIWELDAAAREIKSPAWIHITTAPQNHDS